MNEITKNEVFKDGCMWLPVISTENLSNVSKKPWMTKTDLGSMRPVLEIKFGNVFSTVIPYENIVAFTYELPSGQATISFLDTSPVLVTFIARELMNQTDKPITLQFGWSIQNALEGGDMPFEKLTSNTIFENKDVNKDRIMGDELELYVVNASYKYSNFGLMVDLKAVGYTKNTLNSVIIKKNPNTFQNAESIDDLSQKITSIINSHTNATQNGTEYKVEIKDKRIQIDKTKALSFTEDMSIFAWLNTIVGSMYIKVKDKEAPQGIVEMYIPLKKETQADGTSKKQVQMIYIYNKENAVKEPFNIPLIEYPQQDSPITSFQPNIDDSAGLMFLAYQNYVVTDKDGNKNVQKRLSGVAAGQNSTPTSTGETKNTAGSITKTENKPTQNRIIATIDISMLGDPILSNYNSLWHIVKVRNNIVVQEGMVRFPGSKDGQSYTTNNNGEIISKEGFFASYPGFNLFDPKYSNLNGWSAEEVQMDSPLNGNYIIQKITHEISIANGYKTTLSLLYYLEDL